MANIRLYPVNINNGPYVYADTVIFDHYSNVIFLSAVGYTGAIKRVEKEINRVNTMYISGLGNYRLRPSGFKVERRKTQDNDYHHLIAYKKSTIEEIENTDNLRMTIYMFYGAGESLEDKVFQCLSEHTSVPILPEWKTFITSRLEYMGFLHQCEVSSAVRPSAVRACDISCTKNDIKAIITRGLATREISINGSNTPSSIMNDINGLDDYLTVFSGSLAEKIQQSFVPKHMPGMPMCDRFKEFDDYVYYKTGMELFDAQRDIVQANINHLEDNDVALVIGEMGSGKTVMGSAITYAASKKDGFCSIVMCPSHLVMKWRREIDSTVPNSRTFIVHNLQELMELDSNIRDKHRTYNMYIIISKENAKFSFETRPAAKWSTAKQAFVCPKCGMVLKKRIYYGTGRNRECIEEKFALIDFLKEMKINEVCTNTVRKWNPEKHVYDEENCDCKLWGPVNGTDTSSEWIKLGKEGWVMARHVDELLQQYSSIQSPKRAETALLVRLIEAKDKLDKGDYRYSSPRKFSMSKYISNNYSGLIDYLVLDELHLLKSQSLQGMAMMDLVNASKKVIGLTGTLLNGYADGLFYLLFRMMGHKMAEDDFEYNDEAEFTRQFGVTKNTSRFCFTNNTMGNKVDSSEKKLPGVSPLVFTKYLLDTASFIALADMSEGLPPYQEIPIGLDMDEELGRTYEELEGSLKRLCAINGRGGSKTLGSLLQTLSVYPDQPFNQPPIIHPDSGEVLFIPPELPDIYRNKEQELLRICLEKKAKGEKVLIYYQWTNRTDLDTKLTRLLSENGIRAITLKSSVKTEDREEWIEQHVDDDVDAMICNPQLVETGLDLLQFTTIVFYQVGYNIFTMRQASRRSWRLSQTKPIEVYFLYYKNTIQEQALSLMATKLQASMAIEGKFSEEGLRAMSNNEDLLTQIANSVVKGIKQQVMAEQFASVNVAKPVDEAKPLKHNHLPFQYLNNGTNKNGSRRAMLKQLNNVAYSVANLV